MSNLLKVRHFLVPDDEMHANIFEVGRIKSLQELRRFKMGKESQGFELWQIGNLVELCGSFSVDNLENVEGREEAEETKLIHKKHVQELIFTWNVERPNKDPAREEQVLQGLKPHSNLLKLIIKGHGGANCPSWLVGLNLSVENLESLCLDGVAWETFPPIGELRLVNKNVEEISSNINGRYFNNMKRIEPVNLPRLESWVVGSTVTVGQLMSHLEVLIIRRCYELVELCFSISTCSQQEQNASKFPRLQDLRIDDCPKLLSLPPVPWSNAQCSVQISGVRGLGFEYLQYGNDSYEHVLFLKIFGNDHTQDMAFWTTLDFDKLTRIEKLAMEKCPPLPLDALQKLSTTVKVLDISEMNMLSGKELTQMLSFMWKLSELQIQRCEKIRALGVLEQQEEEIAPPDELLLLPPQLEKLYIRHFPELSVGPDSPHGGNGRGLQSFFMEWRRWCLSQTVSLTDLRIDGCGGSRGMGLGRLLAHGCLHKLSVLSTPNFFSIECSKEDTAEMLEQGSSLPPSFNLESLRTDDIAAVLAAPICALLFSSLTTLTFDDNKEIECFTKEQGEAIELLTSD
ncbi:hypothetical protein HU200_000624 [Digitaria exilis]|uniref:R13L1/DRL21-like LRR repeat region domain-containing protein n=1 Tax=Digitaria exilis TaxID=1010633 RepID=A0A835FYL2_9POAL|nr:hypothetical protein HU200_000624 [Digitaria exilis]